MIWLVVAVGLGAFYVLIFALLRASALAQDRGDALAASWPSAPSREGPGPRLSPSHPGPSGRPVSAPHSNS